MSGDGVKERGWRQGSLAEADLVARLGESGCVPGLASEDLVLIVLSHDCDVTNASFEAEPDVELVAARFVPEGARNGSFSHGKNPRRIQFEIVDGTDCRLAEAYARDRFTVDRRLLLEFGPDANRSCEPPTVEALAQWLARRYVRSALPDAFNHRTRPAIGGLKKALKRHGSDITALFVSLNAWTELVEGESYQLVVSATMRDSTFCDPVRRQVAQRALDVMQEKLERCDGIDGVEGRLVSESDVTLEDLRYMRRFDVFDYLSVGDDDGELAARS